MRSADLRGGRDTADDILEVLHLHPGGLVLVVQGQVHPHRHAHVQFLQLPYIPASSKGIRPQG
jgi:hypothetical protein